MHLLERAPADVRPPPCTTASSAIPSASDLEERISALEEEVASTTRPHRGATPKGADVLSERLAACRRPLSRLEATGGSRAGGAALSSAGLAVVVVNPAQVRAYAHALGKRAKTDPIDAAVIAAFVAARSRSCGRCATPRPGTWPSSGPPAPDRADDRGRGEPCPHGSWQSRRRRASSGCSPR